MVCIPSETCALGSGVCESASSNQSFVCVCTDSNYADQSDFLRSTGCFVFRPGFIALWVLNAITWFATTCIGIAAWVLLKRKTPVTERSEKKHIILSLISSSSASVLSILQLTLDQGSGSIAIHPGTSAMFAVSQMMCWASLILRPSTKSETSIARFAMEQSRSITSLYFILAPVFMSVNLACCALAIAGSAVALSQETDIVSAYFFLTGVGFSLVSFHMVLSLVSAKRQFERALANSMVVNKRSSVKVRIEKFVARAKRVMIVSFFVVFALAVFAIVMGACEQCRRRTLWALMPVMTFVSSAFIFRGLVNSLRASFANRKNSDKSTQQVQDNIRSNSGENPSPQSPPQLRTSKKSAQLKQMGGQKKKAAAALQRKLMTVVVEGDYEGTVAMSQLESVGIAPERSPRAEDSVAQTLSVHEEFPSMEPRTASTN